MADILVQNAVEAVKTAIEDNASGYNYTQLFGKSLADRVNELITANASAGPYAPSQGAGSLYLCDLSDPNKISKCNCYYWGYGVNNPSTTKNENHFWVNGDLLSGSANVGATEVREAIVALDSDLNSLYDFDNTIENDIYYAYLSQQSVFTAASNTTVLTNWYGQGGSNAAAPGAKLGSNVLKVCGSGWKCGEGNTCSWTVPSGVTRVKFQAWGGGQGSNPGCCCGGAPWSSTGSYSEIELDVTPGETYTLCAGCSCQRSCCSNSPPGCGCMSGVTGPGICCFRAEGSGCFEANCQSMNYMRTNTSGSAGGSCYRFQNPYCTQSGPCWCSYNEYCFDNSCATCGQVPVYPNCCYMNICICARTDRNAVDGVQRGHIGIIGGGCLQNDNYGYHTRPPIIDADTGTLLTSGCEIQTFSSGSNCGGCNAHNWTKHPGMGGTATHNMGGTNNHKGDYGSGGMIQVSW